VDECVPFSLKADFFSSLLKSVQQQEEHTNGSEDGSYEGGGDVEGGHPLLTRTRAGDAYAPDKAFADEIGKSSHRSLQLLKMDWISLADMQILRQNRRLLLWIARGIF
jgi:hypothetical protein